MSLIVPIPVHVLVDRLPVLADVLVDVERVHRHARRENLDLVPTPPDDVADQDLERRPPNGVMLLSSLVLWAAVKSAFQLSPSLPAFQHRALRLNSMPRSSACCRCWW